MMTLTQVAKLLVAHGINGTFSHPDDAADFAAFVAASCSSSGCSVRALRNYLGY